MILRFAKRLFSLFFLASILFIPLPPYANSTPPSAQEIKTIYDLSTLEQQSTYLGQTFIKEGLAIGRLELPESPERDAILERLEQGLKTRYAPERLQAKILSTLTREIGSGEAEEIIELMQTPVWQRAVALERAFNNIITTQHLEEYIAKTLRDKEPREIRVQLVQQLAQLANTAPTMMELMIGASVTAASILMTQQNVRVNFEMEVRKQMESMRDKHQELVIQQLLYTYRHMPDEDLKAYVALNTTPAIKNLNSVVSRALTEAFR